MNSALDRYFALATEDWSSVEFKGRVNAEADRNKLYYVYTHVDTMDGMHPESSWLEIPFYIGMGTGRRALDFNRSRGHRRKRIQMCREGGELRKRIIGRCLDYRTARVLESKLIVFWGCSDKPGPCLSGMIPSLVNGRYEPYPDHYRNEG
jgi:hypothetical protein